MIVVADASAVATVLLPDEEGPFAEFARRVCETERLALPSHWRVEMASVLWKARRRKRLSDEDARQLADRVEAIASVADQGPQEPTQDLLDAATTHGLTPYDAAYLLLARRLNAALLSTDHDLCAAAAVDRIVVLAP